VLGVSKPPIALSPGEPQLEAVPLATRISAIGGTTLTLQTNTNNAGWVAGMPDWLKLPVTTGFAVNQILVNGVLRTCTGIVTATSLAGCTAAPAGGYANGTVVSRTRPDGSVINTTITPAVAAGATTYTVASTAGFFQASRTFFAGEDPVTCTGYAPAAFQLTGCTWGAGTVAVNDPIYTGATTAANTPLLHGFIKIEKQNAANVWSDVTLEILNLGFAGRNQSGDLCADPTPNAVIRIQRLRDSGLGAGGCAGANNYAAPTIAGVNQSAYDYWPNMLFDPREAGTRTVATTADMAAGGLFSYIALDVGNVKRWFAGAIGATGSQAWDNNGYIVYFSDRRGDHNENAADIETGEYGFEDSINTAGAVCA
jgi:hypothetical protein